LSIFGRNHKRILVARPDRIGDVVLSTPVFHTLKDSFPGSFIAALVSPYTGPLLKGNPYIDAVITDGPARKNLRMKVRELRKYKFDTALLLMPTKRLAYMTFLAGIPYRVGVGRILYEVITLMHGVSRRKYNPLRHESEYMLDLARRIGAQKIWTQPEIFLTTEEKDFAHEFLMRKGFDLGRAIIAIHPGSGHSSPSWKPETYSALASMLVRNGTQVFVTGADHEKYIEEFFSKITGKDIRTSFGELSLREMTSVISQMSLLISSSTGPMHIAAAVGTPTVSTFCPLTACSPKLWGPIGASSAHKVILPPENFCKTQCPGDPHVCTFGDGTSGIAVREVFDAAVQTIRKTEEIPVSGVSGFSSEMQRLR